MNHPALPVDGRPSPQVPPSRYGASGPRSRTRGRILVALLVAAALGWLLWAALAAANPETRSQILGFRALDDHRIEATLEVVADAGTTVDCTLRAQDSDHVTTGVARVVSPPGPSQRRLVRTVVKTRDRAVAVTVVGCRRRD